MIITKFFEKFSVNDGTRMQEIEKSKNQIKNTKRKEPEDFIALN